MATNGTAAGQAATRDENLAPLILAQVRRYTVHQVMEFVDNASVFNDIDLTVRTAFVNPHLN
jgi:hypothetical protein